VVELVGRAHREGLRAETLGVPVELIAGVQPRELTLAVQ